MLVEIEQRYIKIPMDDIIKLLLSWDYEAFFFDGRLMPYHLFDYHKHQYVFLEKLTSQKQIRGYINNFIFLRGHSYTLYKLWNLQ